MWDWGSGTIEIAPQGKRMMLTQLAYLLAEGSLREQLLYPGAVGVSDAELLETMRLVNLSTFVERLTDDLKKEVVDWHALSEDKQNELLFSLVINWDSLSGGEKQRLVAARAIVNKVQMVLADEATSGLDIANEELLYRAMKSHGITLLSVGHRPSLVPFHEVVVELLNDGEGGWEAMSADESKW
jgi:putative ATP-binding cassette transporter